MVPSDLCARCVDYMPHSESLSAPLLRVLLGGRRQQSTTIGWKGTSITHYEEITTRAPGDGSGWRRQLVHFCTMDSDDFILKCAELKVVYIVTLSSLHLMFSRPLRYGSQSLVKISILIEK